MTIADWISHHADWDGDKVAIRFEGQEIDYAAFDRRVRQLATLLRVELGIAPGDRVAHLGYNSPELLDLLFACARLGAIMVPLNWRLAASEHAWILRDCGASAVLAEADFVPHLEPVRASLGRLRLVAYDGAGDGWLSYADLLGAAAGNDASAGGDLDAPVKIVYTSGTTGRPKGAVLTQNALFFNAVNATAVFDMTRADHVLTVLPMFHVGGMNIQTTPALHAGATVTLHRRFEPGAALRAIAEDRPSLFLAVPAVIAAMAQHPEWSTTDIGSLRAVGAGSSTVPEALLRVFLDRGVPVSQVYGLTESAPVAVCLPLVDAWRKLGSTGKPALHCAMRVVDDEGRSVAPGMAGEIQLKGPNLLREYWNNPQATGEAYIDGWFRTGDVGHLDEDGYLYVDDRKKDVVISGGENIYPAELENVLAECPALAEFAVVGRADPRWGEVPVACVVTKPDAAITEADVLALFDDRIARYKHPRAVLFMESLPRNVMGKVLKFELREQLARQSDAESKA